MKTRSEGIQAVITTVSILTAFLGFISAVQWQRINKEREAREKEMLRLIRLLPGIIKR